MPSIKFNLNLDRLVKLYLKMKATSPISDSTRVVPLLTRQQKEINAILAKFASGQRLALQELSRIDSAIDAQTDPITKQSYVEILFTALRDTSRPDYIISCNTLLRAFSRTEVCEGIIFPDDIIEILSDKITIRAEQVSQIFKNIAKTQELPKQLKDKLLSFLKDKNIDTRGKAIADVIALSRERLSGENVLVIEQAIERINQDQISSCRDIISPQVKEARLAYYDLLAQTKNVTRRTIYSLKSLADKTKDPQERLSLERLTKEIKKITPIERDYSETYYKRSVGQLFFIDPRGVILPEIESLLKSDQPLAKSIAIRAISAQLKENVKFPPGIIKTLEAFIHAGGEESLTEQEKNALYNCLSTLVIKQKYYRLLSETNNLANEAIFKGLYQLTVSGRKLPAPIVQRLLELSVAKEADISVRTRSLLLLQDSFSCLNQHSLTILAQNLSDENLSIASTTVEIFNTVHSNDSLPSGTLTRILTSNILAHNPGIREKTEPLLLELAELSRQQLSGFAGSSSNVSDIYTNSDNETILVTSSDSSESIERATLTEEPEEKENSNPVSSSVALLGQEALEAQEEVVSDRQLLSAPQLIEVITDLNKTNPELTSFISSGKFTQQFEAVKQCYGDDSALLAQGMPIKQWSEEAIKNLSAHLIANPSIAKDKANLPEIIAVTMRANRICSQYELRDVQILSLLILLAGNGQGRLAEIGTGEGKSTTTAILASIKALQGEAVDVITSSPLLAKRDAQSWQRYFDMLSLSASHNINPDYQSGFKECYSSNIVYGDVGSFQGDWLKTVYRALDTRGQRPFGVAIVDEVDSMLIDESSKIVKLSSPLPGAEYIAPLFIAAWREATNINKRCVYLEEEQTHVFIPEDFKYEGGRLTLLTDDREALEKIIVIEDIDSFKTEHIESYLQALIGQNGVMIPSHLRNIVLNQVSNWAKSAVMAQSLTLKKHYLIIHDKDGEKRIAPIDYLNTGIVQANTAWQHGLQQFLQVKHSLKITPESHTTSFISNMGYFKAYGTNIYGLTGTLGSEDSRNLLQDIYKIDLALIPRYKAERFEEIDGILTNNREEWLTQIVSRTSQEARANRAVLIICQTIADVEDIEGQLKSQRSSFSKIVRYSRNDNDENLAVDTELRTGNVIIATNLAGRGTDIKLTKQVEDNGGLHVCVTFLPTNSRVEKQAFGRTARQGEPGTAQLIVNKEEIFKKLKIERELQDITTLAALREFRDLFERSRLRDTREHQVSKLTLNDHLFSLYCAFYNQLKDEGHNKFKLMQVEEDWGSKFRDIQEAYDSSSLSSEAKAGQALASFEQFKAEISRDIGSNKIIKNPAYLIKQGLDGLGRGNSYRESIEAFSQSVNLDDVFSFAGHYNLAYARLREGYMDAARAGKATPTYTAYHREVAQSLYTAKEQIEKAIIPGLQAMQILSPELGDTPLSQQIRSKIELMQLLLRFIDGAIASVTSGEVNEAMKVGGNPQLLNSFFDSNKLPRNEIDELQNLGLYQLYNISREELGNTAFEAAAVAALGIAQAMLGALAVATGNPQLGITLIMEGFKDVYAASQVSEGGFRWNNYFLDKGITVATYCATQGMEKMFAKPANTAGQQALKKGITDKVLLDQAQRAAQRELIKTAIVEAGLSTLLNIGAKNLSTAAIKSRQEDIIGSVDNKVLHILDSSPTRERLNHIIAMDRINGDNQYQNHLRSLVKDILITKRHIVAEVSSGVLSSLMNSNSTIGSTKVSTIAWGLKGMEVGYELSRILDLTQEFCADLADKIAVIEQQLPDLAGILQQKLRPGINNRQEAEEVVALLTQTGIWNGHSFDEARLGFISGAASLTRGEESKSQGIQPIQLTELTRARGLENSSHSGSIGDISFGKHERLKSRIIDLVKTINRAMHGDYVEERRALAAEFSGSLSGTVNRRIAGKVVMPVASGFIHDFSKEINQQFFSSLRTGVAAGSEERGFIGNLREWLESKYPARRRQAKGQEVNKRQISANSNRESSKAITKSRSASELTGAMVPYGPQLPENLEHQITMLQIAEKQTLSAHRNADFSVEAIAGLFDQSGAPLPRVIRPQWQPKTLREVRSNLYNEFFNPSNISSRYYGNLPLAVFSGGGELLEYGAQKFAHMVGHFEGGHETLTGIAYPVGFALDEFKSMVKTSLQSLSKEQYRAAAEFYHGLPHGAQLLVSASSDGFILFGAGKALTLAAKIPKSQASRGQAMRANSLVLDFMMDEYTQAAIATRNLRNLVERNNHIGLRAGELLSAKNSLLSSPNKAGRSQINRSQPTFTEFYSTKEIIERNTGIVLEKEAVILRRQLSSSLQMKESHRIIAGSRSGTKFRDVDRIVETYGGMKEDWVKMSSSKIDATTYDSLELETHWIENLKTGQKVEFKTIKIKGR